MKGGAGVAKGEGEPIARAHVLLKAIVHRAFDKGTQPVPAHLPPPSSFLAAARAVRALPSRSAFI